MAHGNFTYLAIGKETTNGQKASTRNIFLNYSGYNFKKDIDVFERGIATSRLVKAAPELGTEKISGSVKGHIVDIDKTCYLLKSFLLSESVANNGDETYTHTFTTNEDYTANYTGLTFEAYKITTLEWFTGMRVTKMSFKAGVNDFLKLDFDLKGLDYSTSANPQSEKQAVNLSNAYQLRWYEGVFKVNTQSLPIKNFSLELSENAEEDFNFASGRKAGGLLRGMIEGKVSFELDYNAQAKAILEDYYAGAVASVEITFTTAQDIVSGVKGLFEFTIPAVKYTGVDADVSANSLISASVDGDIIVPDTGEVLAIEVRNTNQNSY